MRLQVFVVQDDLNKTKQRSVQKNLLNPEVWLALLDKNVQQSDLVSDKVPRWRDLTSLALAKKSTGFSAFRKAVTVKLWKSVRSPSVYPSAWNRKAATHQVFIFEKHQNRNHAIFNHSGILGVSQQYFWKYYASSVHTFGFLTGISSLTVLACTSTSLKACLGSKNLLSILSGARKPGKDIIQM